MEYPLHLREDISCAHSPTHYIKIISHIVVEVHCFVVSEASEALYSFVFVMETEV